MSDLLIAVRGAFGQGNFGDDALMVAVDDILGNVPGVRPVFVAEDPVLIAGLLTFGVAVDSAAQAQLSPDAILYGGGTQFFSFPLTRQRWWRRLASLCSSLPRRVLGQIRRSLEPGGGRRAVPQFALGIGVGPFCSGDNREGRARRLLGRMSYLAVRDTASLSWCQRNGIAGVVLRSDLCFSPDLWGICCANRRAAKPEARRVVVVPRDWPHTKEGAAYSEPLMDAVKEMRSQGRRVEFMLFAPSRDQEWLERLREAGESPICWDPSALTIDEFLAKVASYDLVITARYHGAVFAALLGVPCVSISVEPKLDLVATLFGAGAREWGYPFLSCSLLAAVESLERRYADAVEALRIMVEAQGMLAAEMRRELCREIDRKLGSRRS